MLAAEDLWSRDTFAVVDEKAPPAHPEGWDPEHELMKFVFASKADWKGYLRRKGFQSKHHRRLREDALSLGAEKVLKTFRRRGGDPNFKITHAWNDFMVGNADPLRNYVKRAVLTAVSDIIRRGADLEHVDGVLVSALPDSRRSGDDDRDERDDLGEWDDPTFDAVSTLIHGSSDGEWPMPSDDFDGQAEAFRELSRILEKLNIPTSSFAERFGSWTLGATPDDILPFLRLLDALGIHPSEVRKATVSRYGSADEALAGFESFLRRNPKFRPEWYGVLVLVCAGVQREQMPMPERAYDRRRLTLQANFQKWLEGHEADETEGSDR